MTALSTILVGLVVFTTACTEVVNPRECESAEDCTRFGEGSKWACTEGFCRAQRGCVNGQPCGDGRVCIEGVCTSVVEERNDVGEDVTPEPQQQIVITGAIDDDTHWASDARFILDGTVVITNDAELTIEAGTRIEARPNAALVVEPGTTLRAAGTREDPIVFTSGKREGLRSPGDWAGIVMLGRGPTNDFGAKLEGLDASTGAFGGSDPGYRCGVLEYVRVEFAGNAERTPAALTLAGCGSATILNHVQVHGAERDAMAFLGGTANASNLALTAAGRAGLSWSLGWTGRVQFVIIQGDDNADFAIEGVNHVDDEDARPRSAPTLYNATLVGSSDGTSGGLHLYRGTAGAFRNGIVAGTSAGVVDVGGHASVEQFHAGNLSISNSLFATTDDAVFPAEDNVALNDDAPDVDGDGTPDDDITCERSDEAAICGAGFHCVAGFCSFDESRAFTTTALENRTGEPPFSLPVSLFAPEDAPPGWTPQWQPDASANVSTLRTPTGDFWESAQYLGAFDPSATEIWAAGWTAFPQK